MTTHAPALIEEGQNDYILHETADSCWITVGTISVYIVRTDEGVKVELCAKDNELEDELASAYASFDDAEGKQ